MINYCFIISAVSDLNNQRHFLESFKGLNQSQFSSMTKQSTLQTQIIIKQKSTVYNNENVYFMGFPVLFTKTVGVSNIHCASDCDKLKTHSVVFGAIHLELY